MGRNLFADEEECRPQAEAPVKETQEQETWAAEYQAFQDSVGQYEALEESMQGAKNSYYYAADALAKGKERLKDQKERRKALVQTYRERLETARAAAQKNWDDYWEKRLKENEQAVEEKKKKVSELEDTEIRLAETAFRVQKEMESGQEQMNKMKVPGWSLQLPAVFDQEARNILEAARQNGQLTRQQKKLLQTPVSSYLGNHNQELWKVMKQGAIPEEQIKENVRNKVYSKMLTWGFRELLKAEADFCKTDLYYNLKNRSKPQFYNFDKDTESEVRARAMPGLFGPKASWTFLDIAERNEKDINHMIYCYLRHDDICKYLKDLEMMVNAEKVSRLILLNGEVFNQKLEEFKKAEEAIGKLKAELTALVEKRDADKAEVKAKRDAFRQGTLWPKILSGDAAALTELRSQIEAMDKEIADAKGKVDSLGLQAEEKKKLMIQAQEKLDACMETMNQWIRGELLSPLNGETVRFDPRIVMPDCESPGKPLILFHNVRPVVFSYERKDWHEEGAVALISILWRGFVKAVPRQLLDISVVDPARMVSSKIGSAARNRMDFVKSYQEGFAGKDGAVPAKNRIRGLFEEQDIAALDRELEETQRSIQSYEVEHFEEILDSKAVQVHGDPGELPPILRVNSFTLENDTPPFLRPYHVVIFVVPEEEKSWSSVHPKMNPDRIRYMANLIERGNTADFGFLPIFLVSDENQSGYWRHLTEAMKKNGQYIEYLLEDE